MNKSLLLLAVLLLFVSINTLHLQKFAPSQPGGTFQGTNGTQSGGYTQPTPYYNQPQPTPYYNQPQTPYYNNQPRTPYNQSQPTPYYNQLPQTNTNGIYVNGVPYVFTGAFTLACFVQNSNQVFRFQDCFDALGCANLLNDYKNCIGRVAKYPVGTRLK